MGRTSRPTHAIHTREWSTTKGVWLHATPAAWRRHYGRPSNASLERWVDSYEASTMPGGPNAHLGEVSVVEARIVDQRSGHTVAHYKAPAFKVRPSARPILNNPYTRKTRDTWVIQGNYGHGWEDESAYDNRREALEDLKRYRENSPGASRLVKKRERIEQNPTRRPRTLSTYRTKAVRGRSSLCI